MADHSDKPEFVGRILRAMVSVLVHGLCLFALFVMLWFGGGEWSRAAHEVLMDRSPTTDALLGLISAIVSRPSTTLNLLSLLLLIDLALLIYLDRSGVWRLGREVWCGTLLLAIVAVACFTGHALSGDTSRHFIHFLRGDEIETEQALKRLDQLAASWKLIGEERDGERTDPSELQHGRLVIERREGLSLYDKPWAYDTPAYAVRLTLAGEEHQGRVAVHIPWLPPEEIELNFENEIPQWGVYRFEDHRLELCLSPAGTYGPVFDFTTKGTPNTLYVFQRMDGTP